MYQLYILSDFPASGSQKGAARHHETANDLVLHTAPQAPDYHTVDGM